MANSFHIVNYKLHKSIPVQVQVQVQAQVETILVVRINVNLAINKSLTLISSPG